MDNKFAVDLVKKSLDRFSLGIEIDKKTGLYKIDRYCNNSEITKQFLEKLNESLINGNKITLKIPFDDFKGFKNSVLKGFIKDNQSMDDWTQFFNVFLYNIPFSSFINALYIKPLWNGNIPNSNLKNYLSFLFKQDFNHQKFTPDEFLKSFNFYFSTKENDYPDLKEFLFTFISNHIHQPRKLIPTYYSNQEQIDSNMKSFELELYSKISNHIKLDDLKLFNQFWPSILIKSENKNMMTQINDNFMFDLNFSYLSDTYKQITNDKIALNTCEFISNIINNNLSEFLDSYILSNTNTDCKFLIHFKKPFNKELLIDLFESIIQLKIDTHQFENLHLKFEYREQFDTGIEILKKQTYSYVIDSQLNKNNTPKISIINKI